MKETRECKVCGELFTPRHYKQLICSKECKNVRKMELRRQSALNTPQHVKDGFLGLFYTHTKKEVMSLLGINEGCFNNLVIFRKEL